MSNNTKKLIQDLCKKYHEFNKLKTDLKKNCVEHINEFHDYYYPKHTWWKPATIIDYKCMKNVDYEYIELKSNPDGDGDFFAVTIKKEHLFNPDKLRKLIAKQEMDRISSEKAKEEVLKSDEYAQYEKLKKKFGNI